jgi:hypothetical protein
MDLLMGILCCELTVYVVVERHVCVGCRSRGANAPGLVEEVFGKILQLVSCNFWIVVVDRFVEALSMWAVLRRLVYVYGGVYNSWVFPACLHVRFEALRNMLSIKMARAQV